MLEKAREAVREKAEMTRFGAVPVVVVLTLAAACACVAWAEDPDPGLAGGGRAVAVEAGLDREEATLDADQATRIFREANALYAEGAYDEAAERYERVLSGGIEDADVRYNLANAYFKDGAVGRAVLNYERALRLDPGHEDARANLEFVTETLADRQASVGGPVSELLADAYARAVPARLAVWASVFYFGLMGALILGVLKGALVGWVARLAVVAGILLVVTASLLAVRLTRLRSVREAIVLAPEVAVRTGPGEDFVLEFRLHEGTKVRAREDRDDWARISVAGSDLEGWLPAGTLEEI